MKERKKKNANREEPRREEEGPEGRRRRMKIYLEAVTFYWCLWFNETGDCVEDSL